MTKVHSHVSEFINAIHATSLNQISPPPCQYLTADVPSYERGPGMGPLGEHLSQYVRTL